MTMSVLFSFLLFFLFQTREVFGEKLTISSALYVFGDSVMDPGNNIFLKTPVKVNYLPFGIDFPGGPTGRFTNGYTIADYWYTLANPKLKNPIPLPYMSPSKCLGSNTTGLNYASGTAGILRDTNQNIGENLWLGKQVVLFKETIKQRNRVDISLHVSQSIYVVCMGGNDFMNYLEPGSSMSKSFNPEQFSVFLAKQLGNHLQDLYKLGARKFVVFQIGPLGCLPAVLDKTKPSTRCDDHINSLVSNFNGKLDSELNDLSSKLKQSTFVTVKNYQLILDIIHNPLQHGFEEARYPCCTSGSGNCLPGTKPCEIRNSYMFWDSVHPTQAINRIVADKCFNGKGLCTPLNMVQLFAKR